MECELDWRQRKKGGVDEQGEWRGAKGPTDVEEFYWAWLSKPSGGMGHVVVERDFSCGEVSGEGRV